MPVRLSHTPLRRMAPLAAAVVWVASVALLGGCGGSDPGPAAANVGSLALTVNWPAVRGVDSAAIPAAAQSVGVDLSTRGGWSAQATVARPANGGAAIMTVSDVPVGPVHLHFGAYSGLPVAGRAGSLVPSGDLLAWAVDDVTVVAGETQAVQFTLSGVPDHVTVSAGGASTVLPIGHDLQLYATAYDADGNLLAVPAWTWTSSYPRRADVSETGLVLAASAGEVTISASYAGVTGQVLVTVPTPPAVTLTADDPIIRRGTSTTLRWTSTNATSVVSSNFGATDVTGTMVVSPVVTTDYTITVAGPGGEATGTTTVSMSAVAALPAPEGANRP